MPDRTISPEKRRASNRIRLRRWRGKKKEQARLAALEEKRLRREALDRARVARGLLPIREAKAASLAKFRAKQKELREIVNNSWFAPRLTDAEFHQYAKENGWDDKQARRRRESFENATRIAALNLNRFVLDNYCEKALDQRFHFHEAVQSGMSIRDAVEFAKTAKFVPRGRTDIERQLNQQERYEAAKWAWFGREDEIVAAVLGKEYVSEFDAA